MSPTTQKSQPHQGESRRTQERKHYRYSTTINTTAGQKNEIYPKHTESEGTGGGSGKKSASRLSNIHSRRRPPQAVQHSDNYDTYWLHPSKQVTLICLTKTCCSTNFCSVRRYNCFGGKLSAGRKKEKEREIPVEHDHVSRNVFGKHLERVRNKRRGR